MLEMLLRERVDVLVNDWLGKVGSDLRLKPYLDGVIGRGLIAELVSDYAVALQRGVEALPKLPPGVRSLCGCLCDPRYDAALWIEILAAGRDVLAQFLECAGEDRPAFGRVQGDELFGELEVAFRFLAHRRLQDLCESCLGLIEQRSREHSVEA